MSKILVNTSSFNRANFIGYETILRTGHEILFNPYKRKLEEHELLELLDDSTVAVIAGLEPITRKAFEKAPNLKVLSRCGAGLDNVDLQAAKEFGVSIYSTPDAPSDAVAELTVGLMLDLLRHISLTDRYVRQGQWVRKTGNLLSSQTVGIFGCGRIGRKVGKLVGCFGARAIFTDVRQVEGERILDPEYLFSRSTIISLHMPHVEQNHHYINAERLALMNEKTIIINTSRGELIDEAALYQAVKSRSIAGAGLDVFKEEPYTGPLRELENVLLTSHIGSYAEESRNLQEQQASRNLLDALEILELL